MEFYQELAADYDEMTRLDQRLKSEKTVLTEWVKKYQFQSV